MNPNRILISFQYIAQSPSFPDADWENVCTHGPNSTYWATHPKKIRRAIKYHLNVFTMGLSSVEGYSVDSEMSIKYDACSPINEHTPTAEVIQRWQGLMREIRGSFDLLCPEFIIAHWPVGRSGQGRKIGMRTST